MSRDGRVTGSADDFAIVIELRRDGDEFLHVGAAFELLGRFPKGQTLTRVVEEDSTIASPHDTPTDSRKEGEEGEEGGGKGEGMERGVEEGREG